jgi:hypothetical protein
MDDIMRQNPELMQQFTQAAVSSMSNNTLGGGGGAPNGRGSGFGNFMNDIIGGGGGGGGGGSGGGFGRNNEPPPYAQHRPPPPPIATKGPVAPPPPVRPGATAMPTPMSIDQKSRRPEMRGPSSDVSDMMSRLKTKTINIQSTGSGPASATANSETSGNLTLQNILSGMTGSDANNDIHLEPTVVNVNSLGELPQDSTPHKSKRRPRSERNTVSMDL